MGDKINETDTKKMPQYNTGITATFAAKYVSIAKVDLNSGDAFVLKSDMDPEIVGVSLPWMKLLERYMQRRVHPEDRDLLRDLTLDRLIAYYDQTEMIFPIELRCVRQENKHDWVRVLADAVLDEDRQLLISTQIVNNDHILRRIIDLYVYRNYDYFILLDAKNNTYTTFSNKPGVIALPPMTGDDYEAEVKRFNDQYVPGGQADIVTAKMTIAHVVEMLKTQESYSFTTGMVSEENEYQHSRVSFTYYDKSAGLILLTRTNITQMYLEELENKRKLAAALREAQHDPMTGLYNKKAMRNLINSTLDSQYQMQAAILFIDIDNFKLVNDTLGHQKGDEVLCYFGRTLARLAEEDGVAGRIGGDEFLLFIPEVYDIKQVGQYAEEICLLLKDKPEIGIGELPVSSSVGVAIYPRDGNKYEDLLYKADQALYHAKRYGKSQYTFYSLQSS